MNSIGTNLKKERLRLGMSQEQFATAGGIKRRAQLSYEQNERSPDANYLHAVSAIGVDVQYVLTGKASSDALTDDENALLAGYRKLDICGKAGVLGAISGMSAPPVSHVEFHGQVGQQINGDITGPQTINMGGSKKKTKE